MRILLIEDHHNLGAAVSEALSRARYVVDWVKTLEEARSSIRTTNYDLLLLDLSLPDGNGLVFLKEVRGNGLQTPIMVLTARGGLNDRVAGLDEGADDYLVKPFALSELVSRCRAILRRPERLQKETIRIGNLEFETGSGDVMVNGQPFVAARRELQLLVALVRRSGRPCSRAYLEDALYEHGVAVTPNALETSVSRLRQQLKNAQADAELRTIRGIGYLLGTVEDA